MDCPPEPPTPSIDVRDVTKRFGDFVAVDRVALQIRRGEFFSLLGPSGCGKTTLLRMIAGLEDASEGNLRLNGSDVTHVPAYRRPVNLVFQHFALFPHLTVEKNVAFGLKYQAVPRSEYAARVEESLNLVRLAGLSGRYPHELSGGQKQRVALARALVLRPQVLLLDEPLGALDQKLRKEMQVELKQLQRELGITFIFVTHDQEEAMTMSDRVAVMNAGRVEQCDAAETVFETPRTAFVAEFVGAANFFNATVVATNGQSIRVRMAEEAEVELPDRGRPYTPGQSIRFIVRPEKLSLSPAPLSGKCATPARIEQRVYQGVNTIYMLRDQSGEPITVCQQNSRPFDPDAAKIGEKVFACWDATHGVVLET